MFNVKARALREPPMPVFAKYPSSVRYDAISWNPIRCYIMALFQPLRVFLACFSLAMAQLFTNINRMILGKETVTETINEKGEKIKNVSFEEEQSKIFMFIQRQIFIVVSRFCLFCIGLSPTKKKQQVSDFLSDYVKYEKMQKNKLAPIIISNHCTIADYLFFLHLKRPAGFLADAKIKNMPLYGKLSQTMQGIYLDRGSNNSKDQALEAIMNRVKNIQEGKDIPQILIFPEGVVNCAEELMSFKPGAFASFSPLKIYAMKIEPDVQKLPSWSLFSEIETMLYLVSETQFPITIYEFDNFDPMYTLDRHGITKDHPDAIELVIKDVRYLMEYGCGLRTKANPTCAQKNELATMLYNDMPNGISFKPPNYSIARKN